MRKVVDRLAALGGTPVFSSAPAMNWPPLQRATELALGKVYRSRAWSFNGPLERELCVKFAAAHGAGRGVFMANGTVTLEGILHALGIGRGDEVIVPALTWPATAMAVLYTGARPVFVDVEPDTLCLDPRRVADAVTAKTAAIMPVHLYGSLANMDALLPLAAKHKLAVIEDCAHAHGGRWGDRGVGSLGTAGSFSFQQSKPMCSGEGGMVTTSDAALADRLYRFKHIGYSHGTEQGKAASGPPPGLVCHNYRATEFQAAILLGQLARLDKMIARRDETAQQLTRELERIPGLRVQRRGGKANPQGYYAYMFTLEMDEWAHVDRVKLLGAFRAEGLPVIGTYGPVYRHALWNASSQSYRMGRECPVSEGPGGQHTFGMLHPVLDWSRPNLQRLVEAVAKVQRNAGQLKAC